MENELLKTEESAIQLASELAETIRQTEATLQALDLRQKAYKDELTALMLQHNVTKITNPFLEITLVPASESVTVDSKKLKEQYFDTYAECTKLTKRSPYVKIRLLQE